MATLSEIRRNNLLRLRNHIEKEYNKNPKNSKVRFTDVLFCQLIGLSPSTYSQLKSSKHKPNFNEIYVRKIEKQLNLDLGWFDIDRDSQDVSKLKLNYSQFKAGLLSYHEFMTAQIITINDEIKREHLIENLFLFLHKQTDNQSIHVDEADFYEFLK